MPLCPPTKLHRLILCTLPLLLLGCVSTPAPMPAEPDTRRFETAEYLAQKALPIVKASSLYARGGTGQGVRVALIDSGLNLELPEFNGRVTIHRPAGWEGTIKRDHGEAAIAAGRALALGGDNGTDARRRSVARSSDRPAS